MLTIFNLNIHKTPYSPENISTRIMLVYDKRENIKEFRILNSGIKEEMDGWIKSWLEENIEVDEIFEGLNSNDIDIDVLPKPREA